MRARYLKGTTFFEYKNSGGSSQVWKGICEAKSFIEKGACYKLGNCYNKNPWCEPWVRSLPNFTPIAKEGVYRGTIRRIVDLKDLLMDGWMDGMLLL